MYLVTLSYNLKRSLGSFGKWCHGDRQTWNLIVSSANLLDGFEQPSLISESRNLIDRRHYIMTKPEDLRWSQVQGHGGEMRCSGGTPRQRAIFLSCFWFPHPFPAPFCSLVRKLKGGQSFHGASLSGAALNTGGKSPPHSIFNFQFLGTERVKVWVFVKHYVKTLAWISWANVVPGSMVEMLLLFAYHGNDI